MLNAVFFTVHSSPDCAQAANCIIINKMINLIIFIAIRIDLKVQSDKKRTKDAGFSASCHLKKYSGFKMNLNKHPFEQTENALRSAQ